jgi:hypothetical protein
MQLYLVYFGLFEWRLITRSGLFSDEYNAEAAQAKRFDRTTEEPIVISGERESHDSAY